MKKLLAVFLIALLSLSMLSCDRQPSPSSETSPPESPALADDPPETEKPEAEVTEPPAGKPNYTPVPLEIGPEREAFFNEPKDPWGKNDMAVYAPDGDLIYEATKVGPDYYAESAHLNHFDPAVTYRGIAIGDDAYNALKHMNLPEEAVLVLESLNTIGMIEWVTAFSPETLLAFANSDDYRVVSVHLYLDKNLKPVNVINYPDPVKNPGAYTEYDGIQIISIGYLETVELGARSEIWIHTGQTIRNPFPDATAEHQVTYDSLKISYYFARYIDIQEYYAIKNQQK